MSADRPTPAECPHPDDEREGLYEGGKRYYVRCKRCGLRGNSFVVPASGLNSFAAAVKRERGTT